MPFFNADKQIRKLKVEKENKSKSSNKNKYEHIKIAKPDMADGGFKHNTESLTRLQIAMREVAEKKARQERKAREVKAACLAERKEREQNKGGRNICDYQSRRSRVITSGAASSEIS